MLLVGLHILGAALIFTVAAWTPLSTTGSAAALPLPAQERRDLAEQLA